jgi:hypothetical protein
VKYYTIELDGTTQLFRFDIICDGQYQPIWLHFINQYGMFDTARFGLANTMKAEIERKGYSKRPYSFGASSVDYYDSNNVYNESKVNHYQKAGFTYSLFMDMITDAEYEWLYELIMSPQVFAEIDGDFYPVSIKNTDYTFNKIAYSRDYKALSIDIDLNQTRYGFLR